MLTTVAPDLSAIAHRALTPSTTAQCDDVIRCPKMDTDLIFLVDVGDSMIDKLKQVNDFILGMVAKMDFGTVSEPRG